MENHHREGKSSANDPYKSSANDPYHGYMKND